MNDKDAHTIVADPERFEMVQRAFKLFLSGTHSAPEALSVLNDTWGFRTRKMPRSGGKPLARSAFYRMLSNVFYTGMMEHKGQLYQGSHSPMLTQHEFDEMQRLLGRGKVNVRQKREFAFSGLCGAAPAAAASRGGKVKNYKATGRTRSYVYYHCTNGKVVAPSRASPRKK
jgi:hypothetical protein